jgi:hypothetical protein
LSEQLLYRREHLIADVLCTTTSEVLHMQLYKSYWFQPSAETTLTVLGQLNERFVADLRIRKGERVSLSHDDDQQNHLTHLISLSEQEETPSVLPLDITRLTYLVRALCSSGYSGLHPEHASWLGVTECPTSRARSLASCTPQMHKNFHQSLIDIHVLPLKLPICRFEALLHRYLCTFVTLHTHFLILTPGPV